MEHGRWGTAGSHTVGPGRRVLVGPGNPTRPHEIHQRRCGMALLTNLHLRRLVAQVKISEQRHSTAPLVDFVGAGWVTRTYQDAPTRTYRMASGSAPSPMFHLPSSCSFQFSFQGFN